MTFKCAPPAKRLTLAAAQMAPVFLDKQATTAKVCRVIREAGAAGADIIGFPECIIPGYPAWIELLPVDRGVAHDLFLRLWHNSVEVPGPEVDAIGAACREAGVYAIVGVNERRAGTTGTTFNTQLHFGPDGRLRHKHQKYVPTVAEHLIHMPGQTGPEASTHTGDFGTLSGLICGENSNLLAAYALSQHYPVVHVASWPTHFAPPFEMADCVLNSTRGLAYALKSFVINAVGAIDDDAIAAYGVNDEVCAFLEQERKKPLSTILGPDGNIVAGPLAAGEGILYATVDLDQCMLGKYAIDIAGHYNRPELFMDCLKRAARV
ncbi:unnamed protein product [Neofusicoccum parvum]|nr:unnamed protein product [Neofusicoccum parvum]